tara:strand:+ start:422 stop:1147 length:726 start_codon:yes stop_codon:yes gene_type:complete
MKINNLLSPNFDKKRRSKSIIKLVVIHYTGMQSERESIRRLRNPKTKVSSHFVINLKGKIYRLVDDNKVAWHAGISCWGKHQNLNKYSIGIELVNRGHKYGYTNFKKQQLLSLIKICKNLIYKYKIKKQNIVGHSDIAPLRKIDPGEKFPWKKLANKKIGLWYNCNSSFLKRNRNNRILNKKDKLIFIKNLKKIGYCFSNKRKFSLTKTIKAFQRHYRPELINGNFDKECAIIAKNLSKNL